MSEHMVLTEEPYPGWQRIEREGQTPWFKTPVPRKVIRSRKKLEEFLSKEQNNGRMADIDINNFSFKRRYGLRKCTPLDSLPLSGSSTTGSTCSSAPVSLPCDRSRDSTFDDNLRNMVSRLTKTSEVIDHRKLLSKCASNVDEFQGRDGYDTPENFENIKLSIASARDMRNVFDPEFIIDILAPL